MNDDRDSSAPSSEPDMDGGPGDSPLERKLDIVVAQVPQEQGPSEGILLAISGPLEGQYFPLTGQQLLIGRSSRAAIRVDQESLSHHHAQLERLNGIWHIRDLDSTNGTFVNDAAIEEPWPLTPGDMVQTGNTRLAFLAPGIAPSRPFSAVSQTCTPQFVTRLPGATEAPKRSSAKDDEDGEGMSLAEMLQLALTIWKYVRRYSWLLFVFLCLGIAGGTFYAKSHPPPGSAWFEITLSSESKVDVAGGGQENILFVAAGQTFKSLPLISKTLESLGRPSNVGRAKGLQPRLTFVQQGYRTPLWRGEYLAGTAEEAAHFLSAHLRNYLETEIENALQVIRTGIDFLSSQLHEAAADLGKAEGEFIRFQEEHPEIVETAEGNEGTGKPAGGNLTKRLSSARMELASANRALTSDDWVMAKRRQQAAALDQEITGVETRLAALDAKGLGSQHPDIKLLRAQRARLKNQANRLRTAPPTEAERRANPAFHKLQAQVEQLKARQQAAANGLRSQKTAEGEEAKKAKSRPQLEARYAVLVRNLERTRERHDSLLNQLADRELKLELERASAKAHYSLITPPTREPADVKKSALKYRAIGAVLALLLALFIAALVEGRRFWKNNRHALSPTR